MASPIARLAWPPGAGIRAGSYGLVGERTGPPRDVDFAGGCETSSNDCRKTGGMTVRLFDELL